jgi:hypothetical protein
LLIFLILATQLLLFSVKLKQILQLLKLKMNQEKNLLMGTRLAQLPVTLMAYTILV